MTYAGDVEIWVDRHFHSAVHDHELLKQQYAITATKSRTPL